MTENTTWRDRVGAELSDLSSKTKALEKFINSGAFVGITSEAHVRLLLIQLDTMRAYERILQARLAE